MLCYVTVTVYKKSMSKTPWAKCPHENKAVKALHFKAQLPLACVTTFRGYLVSFQCWILTSTRV